MCYAGGPRCANHVGKELAIANNMFDELARIAANRDDAGDDEMIQNAFNRRMELKDEYDSTPTGQKEIAAAIEKASDEKEKEALANRLAIAKERRDEQMAERAERLKRAAEVDGMDEEGKAQEVASLERTIEERVSAPEFDVLLEDRDRTRLELEAAVDAAREQDEHLKDLEVMYTNPVGRNRNPKFSPEQVEEARMTIDDEHEKLRELVDARYAAYCEYNIANDKLEKYKDVTAQSVGRVNEILGDPGTAYEGETLGNCVETAVYDSGTREWLEERAKGIGGSDIGSILKVDPEHGQANYNDFIKSKTEKYTDEEVQAQGEANSTFEGATGRGNAWEPAVIREYMANNPDANVLYSKASWASKYNDRDRANVDGLLSDDGEKPNGILEIKTASDRRHWFKYDDEGNVIGDDIPVGYRAQMLWYLEQTGFEYADIAAKIDDREYVQRRIYAGDPIDPTLVEDKDGNVSPRFGSVRDEMPKIEAAWDNVESRNNGTYKAPQPKTKMDDMHTKNKIERSTDNVAAWTGLSRKDARNVITGYKDYVKSASAKGERVLNRDAYMVEFMKQNGGKGNVARDRVYVDIETSGMTPATGEIIEIGMKRVTPTGEVTFEYTERYGVRDERTLDTRLGTGMVEVHRIEPDDIRGKRSFRNPEVQKIMDEHLNDENAVMVAHNDNFEKRWFNQHVDGFRKKHSLYTTERHLAEKAGKTPKDPALSQDTMWTSRYLTEHTSNNKLATFTTGHGIAYENAHAADADTDMTHRAEDEFNRLFRSAPRGLRYRPDGEYDTNLAYLA